MSTEVQQPVQPEPVAEQAAAEAAPAENGAAGAKEEPKKAKPAPIDPKEDFVGWVGQQIPNAIHKFNFYVLRWAVELAYPAVEGASEEEQAQKPKLPATEEVTKSQFLNYLKDGQLLARLANRLQPGAVAEPKEGAEHKGTKEDSKHNLDAFIQFAKDKAGLPEQQVFQAEDLLEKGKAGFSQVLNTLFQLTHVAKEKFDQPGLDLDAVITEIAGIAPKSIIEKIRSFVFSKLRRSPSIDKEANKEADKPAEEDKKEEEAAPEAAKEDKKEEEVSFLPLSPLQ